MTKQIKSGRQLVVRRVALSLYEIDIIKGALRLMLVRTHGFGGDGNRLLRRLERIEFET